jgi:putative phosphoribosyl transferase
MNSTRSIFDDRRHAGIALAEVLVEFDRATSSPGFELRDPVVLALPRGGVPVAAEIAARLGAPLDVLVVRKLGVPGHEELAMGAIASARTSGAGAGTRAGRDVIRVLNADVIRSLNISPALIDQVASREQRELERRERAYRGSADPVAVEDRTVILVDDGLATGATMRAAATAVRELGPRSILVAIPVGAASSCAQLEPLVDHLVCLTRPEPFYGVGLWYRDFDQTSDDEVRRLLDANRAGADRLAQPPTEAPDAAAKT